MLDVAEVHARVEAAVAGALPSWRVSAHAWEDLPSIPDGAERSHLTYAVATSSTRWLAGRQLRAVDTLQYCETVIEVRWLHRLRVEARSADYRAALDAEIALVRAIVAAGSNPELQLVLTESARRRELPPPTGPYLLGDLTLTALHHVTLT